MVGWFKKKVEDVPKEEPKKLTLEEKLELFKNKHKEDISKCDMKQASQKSFEIGERVKYDLLNSPIMTVIEFIPYSYSISRFYEKYFHFDSILIGEYSIYLFETSAKITLEYFDSNNVLQTIRTTPDKVIKL